MRRRHYLLAIVALLGLAMFAGCGGKKQDGEEKADTKEEAGTSQKEEDGQKKEEQGGQGYKVEDYVTLGEYKGLSVEYYIPEVTDDDVQMTIQGELEDSAEYTEITDRPAQEGDSVNIDFVGTVDGQEFDGGSAEGYDLVLGSGEFVEGFEENLIGKNAGDTAKFTVTFPEDYDEEIGGKEAEFSVTVNAVNQASVPEYNDAYVASVSDCKTTAEYEAQKKEELLEDEKSNSLMEAQEEALSQAVENATLEGYPQELYDTLRQETVENYQLFAEFMGVEYEDFLAEYVGSEEDLEAEVLIGVNEALVVQAIAEKEGLQVDDEEYQADLKKMAEEEEYDSLEEYEEEYGKDYIMRQILRSKVIDFLYSSAEVSEVSAEDMEEELESSDGEPEGEE